MIFKVMAKNELAKLFENLAVHNRVVGPVQVGNNVQGAPLYAFDDVQEFSQMKLDYTTTRLPAKRFFLPFEEDLATFTAEGDVWKKHIDYNVDGPVVFFGLHPCDINALNKLDKVLTHSVYPMPYYVAKRKNMFIIGIDCMPQPFCFCRSMGSDTALHGFDIFITDIGKKYFVEILSDTAYNFLRHLKIENPDDRDHAQYMKVIDRKNRKFEAQVDTTDLTKILDLEFQSPVWDNWGSRCLGCGSCSHVCPSCYCYSVEENVDIDLQGARKTKKLHSCTLIDFAEVAGGHNFRPHRTDRLKYRYYHKHRGFVEAFEESLCVGCGRCGETCLAGITVPEVIASVRNNGRKK